MQHQAQREHSLRVRDTEPKEAWVHDPRNKLNLAHSIHTQGILVSPMLPAPKSQT